MRALYAAATGMAAQELNVQVISNNIANLRTTGYKRQQAHFQDLLYQNLRRAGTATTCHPVSFMRRSDSSSKSGMPGRESLSTSRPRKYASDARPGSNWDWRANSVSQVACSSAV